MAQNKSLSTQEVADILHISKSTVYELILRSDAFRKELRHFSGNDYRDLGKIMAEV